MPSSTSDETSSPDEIGQVCELHAWPANSMRSTYHGWFHGAIVDGAVQGRDGYEMLPVDPLSTAVQTRQLREGSLTDALGLPGYTVIVHEEPLTSSAIRRTKGRLLPESPPCYAEFVTDDVFFQQDVINGGFLKVLFRFRKFDSGETPVRVFGTYAQRKLRLFPPKPDEDREASFAELNTEFSEAIIEFGNALNPPQKKKSNRSKQGQN